MKALFTLAFTLLLASCSTSGTNPAKEAHSPAPPGAKQLSAAEITTQFIGQSHTSVTSSGQNFSEILMPDGTAKISIAGSSEAKGEWTLSGDVICVTYQAYGEECNIVKADDHWVWFIDSKKGTTNNRFAR